MDEFYGKEDEDVEVFLNQVHVSFIPRGRAYDEVEDREIAKLIYLRSLLGGKVKRWWKSVEAKKRDTWQKAKDMLIARYSEKLLMDTLKRYI